MASLEKRGGIWHIRWRDRRGKLRSVTTKIPVSKKGDELAQKKLEAFERDLRRGVEPSSTILIGKLLDGVVSDYEMNDRKSIDQLNGRIENHLRDWFGALRADKLTTADVREYVVVRQAEGAKNATINHDLNILRRAFTLGRQDGQTEANPYIPRLKASPPRAGFFERSELDALMVHLPDGYRQFVQFLFLTGWRTDEARQLQWRNVDFRAGEVRIDPGASKNDEARSFPMTAELRALLSGLDDKKTLLPWVFTYERWHGRQAKRRQADRVPDIRQIGDIRKAWNVACKKAGLPVIETIRTDKDGKPIRYKQGPDKGKPIVTVKALAIRHDFRRTATRIFSQANVPVKTAMGLTGHKTRSTHDAYNIPSPTDQDMAREKLDMFAKRSQWPGTADTDNEE